VAESLLGAVPFGDLRQAAVLGETGHRPWPLPREPWLMGQVWTDLLFAHWPVPAVSLAPVVPPELPLDTYEGKAWIGVTPFRVRGLRLRGTAPVPVLSSFAEINVRTYVTLEGRPGIFFLSLDASSRPAVFAARRSYRLPYFRAAIEMETGGKGVRFVSRRVSQDGPAAEFAAEYGPRGGRLPVVAGSLERWLTERYCLYTLDERQRVYRADIHHPPWPLRRAWAELSANTMALPFELDLDGEPLLHFSPRQDVALWPIRSLAAEADAGSRL
jgi:uncharacterized protein YqjF (DUF2071 family)